MSRPAGAWKTHRDALRSIEGYLGRSGRVSDIFGRSDETSLCLHFTTVRFPGVTGGTDRGYACVAFSPHNAEQIATLGISPDYLLTIWDWTQEKILLKCKAYAVAEPGTLVATRRLSQGLVNREVSTS